VHVKHVPCELNGSADGSVANSRSNNASTAPVLLWVKEDGSKGLEVRRVHEQGQSAVERRGKDGWQRMVGRLSFVVG